ncbi:hypothetical protein, partial [Streptomyces sp. BE133]|uniref:hypothetical protein n=1 Tax=Streptomyces sp. BE133 TaxID=3002523 RepID=UPI002E78AA74
GFFFFLLCVFCFCFYFFFCCFVWGVVWFGGCCFFFFLFFVWWWGCFGAAGVGVLAALVLPFPPLTALPAICLWVCFALPRVLVG